MPITLIEFLLLLAGTALCCLGFLKKPGRFTDLVHPRFMVPALFWFVGFFPLIYFTVVQPDNDTFLGIRQEQASRAMLYLCACIITFWIGFLLPSGRNPVKWMFGTLPSARELTRLRTAGVLLALASFAMVFGALGLSMFREEWGAPFFEGEWAVYLQKYMVLPAAFLGSLFYGLAWPEKNERHSLQLFVGAFVVLVAASLPVMYNFSRPSGIMPAVMLLGYVLRWRRVPWKTALVAFFLVLYGAQVSLSGRAIYGHFSGVFPFVTHMFDSSNLSASEIGGRMMAADSLTPLSVIIAADRAGVSLDPLTPWHWILFQVPVPHMGGLAGVFTFEPTRYIGGAPGTGYTPSMYGDTYGHFGWWGCLAFVYVGFLYRLLENAVSEAAVEVNEINLPVLALPIGYLAFLMGSFNTYRTWNVAFTFGIGIAVVCIYIFNKLTRPKVEWLGTPDPEPEQPWERGGNLQTPPMAG